MTKIENIFKEAEETVLTSSDNESEEDNDDQDTCTAHELEQAFKFKFKIADESAITLKKDYILNMCQDSAFSRIAVGLSNASVQLFEINSINGLQLIHEDLIPTPKTINPNNPVNICGLHFLDESPNSLLVGTTNGLIRLFDLRMQQEIACFEDPATDADGKKIISCFDRNANGRILCAGTEQHQHNVYLLFYDVRERKQLGGYCDSHQDDVTTVHFHPQNPDLLCTGATDGLINVFDIKEPCEDDALMNTINTESSVHKLNWHHNVYDKDIISCITHTNDFIAFECENGDEVAKFERTEITGAIKRKNAGNFNLISAHNITDDGVFLLAGTNFNKGDTLRSVSLQNRQLIPLADFIENKQIVRESLFDVKQNLLITGGECGIVTLWKPQTTEHAENSNSSRKLKTKTKHKSNKKTPY